MQSDMIQDTAAGPGMNLADRLQWTAWDEYRVSFHCHEIAGGTPKNKDLIKSWIDATNKNKSDEERERIREATVAELGDLAEEQAEKGWTGFKEDENGLYVEGRCVKALLKEAANIIKDVVPLDWEGIEIGMTGFRSKVADHVFVVEDRIYLDRKTPDATEERPIHVMTRQGERTSLKRTDIVKDATVSFTVRRLCGGKVPEPAFVACLQYGMELGFGADRSQGKGKYVDLKINKLRGPGTREPKMKGLKSKKSEE